MTKYNQITKEIIDAINKIQIFEDKKQYLLNIIAPVIYDGKNDKDFHLAKLRNQIRDCQSPTRFEFIIWNMLLSGNKQPARI